MSPTLIGIAGCVALVVLLLSNMPVGLVMAVIGVIGFAWIVNPSAALSMLTADIYDTFSSQTLSVIPLFVLMGQIAFHSGISRRLFAAAYTWLGRMPGGLAISTVGACTAFGAICGSGPATSATMAAVALPEMKRFKYSMELAAGTVAAGGTLGMMIPPSVVFIVYAILTEQSIGDLFLSGILPGLLTAALFGIVIVVQCILRPGLGPVGPKTTLMEKTKALLGVLETLILFSVVMGGMFAGFFTPTEGAAIGAFGAIVIAACQKKLTFKMLMQSLYETIRTSCMVIIIVAGAIIFGHFLAITRLPFEMASGLAGLPLPAWMIMAIILLFYLVAGCFVDALALIILTIPIFYPVVQNLGYHPIWFGVMIVLVTQMGTITPPVGVCVYVVGGMERDIPLQTIFKGAMPFLLALIVAAVLLMLFPQIATCLPDWFDKLQTVSVVLEQ
ncbi:MAG: TRAP transporter large permease [Anaerohalosphaeraceae bacterium]